MIKSDHYVEQKLTALDHNKLPESSTNSLQ